MRELAVQAGNATNSASDRAALQQEVDQLVQQINTVAGQTAFNGVKLLDGTFNSQAFQVGANSGETISITSIASAKADSLGVGTTSSTRHRSPPTVTKGAISTGGITVNGYGVGPSVSDGVSTSATGHQCDHHRYRAAIADGDVKINGVSIGATTGGCARDPAGRRLGLGDQQRDCTRPASRPLTPPACSPSPPRMAEASRSNSAAPLARQPIRV
jgi:flagellin-like hook-associated protein FlgL